MSIFIGKHMVTLYFVVFPREADAYIQEVEESKQAGKRRQEKHCRELERRVKSLKKDELQRELLNAWLELEERDNRYW